MIQGILKVMANMPVIVETEEGIYFVKRDAWNQFAKDSSNTETPRTMRDMSTEHYIFIPRKLQ